MTVLSEGFGGTSHFCVRRDEIEIFCSKLSHMYSTRKGLARLSDNDSDGFIEVDIESGGRVFLNGQVGGSHDDHFVRFSFRTDQTCIPKFIMDFNNLLKNKS